MTWNPLVHMGTNGLIMFAMIGLPSGAMPIDPSRMRGRFDEAKVSLAGPTTNLTLYLLSLSIAVAVAVYGKSLDPDTKHNLWVFFFTGAWINIVLAIFNMFPVPPLDGWRIVSDLWPGYREFWQRGQGPTLGIILFFGLFLFGFRFIVGPASEFTVWTMQLLLRAMHPGAPTP
jgi:Zn-dependent protease